MNNFLEGTVSSKEKNTLKEIFETRLSFPLTLPVSKKSLYGDLLWTWEDSENERLNNCKKSRLRINWEALITKYGLNDQLVDDLKRYAFFRINHSQSVFPKTKKNAHPSSVVTEVGTAAKFLSHLRSELSAGGETLIKSLSDITVQDLIDCLVTYPGELSIVRKILLHLGSDIFSGHLGGGKLQWNSNDISTFSWKKTQSTPFERLPEKLFSLLSNNATKDVKQFLKALEIEPHDTSEIGAGRSLLLEQFPKFGKFFEDYVKYRTDSVLTKKGKHDYMCWVRRMSGQVGYFSKIVEKARTAAQIIIMMYTGARISEFTGFKPGCLRKEDDCWIIVGTVIKDRDMYAATDRDEWIAIPIVRDAVTLLEHLMKITSAIYLFHDSYFAPQGITRQMDSTTVVWRIKKYLNSVDRDGEWKSYKPYAHQFRNSLVFEMRKAGLGLPFITYQLKHSYNALDHSVNNTTLSYGAVGSDAVQKALEDAGVVALRSVYHPDAPVAGGGAEEHKKRRAAYFKGMIQQGFGVDEVILFLAREGAMPLTDVGLGYCQGRSKIMSSGSMVDPPCVGGLQCNPVRCTNAVIPEHKLPMWEKVAQENLARADDPEFSHARSHLLQAANEAGSVIKLFRIERRKN